MWASFSSCFIPIKHVQHFVLDKVETTSRDWQLCSANNANANMVQFVRLYNMKPRLNEFVLVYIFISILLKYSPNNYIKHKIRAF